MQVIALVTGDEFLLPYNLSIDTVDFHDYLSSLTYNWFVEIDPNFAHFDNRYGIDFALIPGPLGLCYNFNIIESERLLNLNL